MIYVWTDKHTKTTLEVSRPAKDSDKEPTVEEAMEAGLTEEEAYNTEWKKQIKGGIGTVGFGQKGYWQEIYQATSNQK